MRVHVSISDMGRLISCQFVKDLLQCEITYVAVQGEKNGSFFGDKKVIASECLANIMPKGANNTFRHYLMANLRTFYGDE